MPKRSLLTILAVASTLVCAGCGSAALESSTTADTLNPAAPTAAPADQQPAPTDAPDQNGDYVAPGVWRCPDATEDATYVGSAQSDKFHDTGCRWADAIHAQNRICFESREAALNFGYEPCDACKP